VDVLHQLLVIRLLFRLLPLLLRLLLRLLPLLLC
jgi:hypothetical protein